uniref:Ig-like domain-containing protein n=1 Tax=Oryctolagus cuniculus TaxID=9986 RepID=A0A5F9DJU0_RABIT
MDFMEQQPPRHWFASPAGMFPAPSLSAQPSPVVASGENVSLSCGSDEAGTAHLLKEGGAGPLHSLEARYSHGAGLWQATFLLGPVDSTQRGIYRCYRADTNKTRVWSLPSDPLQLEVSAPAPQDHTLENLIRMGVFCLVLLSLRLLLAELATATRGSGCRPVVFWRGQRRSEKPRPKWQGRGDSAGTVGNRPPRCGCWELSGGIRGSLFSCGLLPCGCALSRLALPWDSATCRPHVDLHPPPALLRPQGAFCSVSDECSSQCACVGIRVSSQEHGACAK